MSRVLRSIIAVVWASAILWFGMEQGPHVQAETRGQGARPATAVLWSSTVHWYGDRGTTLRAALFSPGKTIARAVGSTEVELSGETEIELELTDEAAGAGEPGFAQAGDRLELQAGTEPAITLTLPALSMDVDTAASRLVGTAPAGATVDVYLENDDELVDLLDIAVDGSGRFQVDTAGKIELTPETFGYVELALPDGHHVQSQMAVPSVSIGMGQIIEGRGAAGTKMHAVLEPPGGPAETTLAAPVLDELAWVLRPSRPSVLAAGTHVKIISEDGPLGTITRWDTVLPELSIALDRVAQRVSGSGPPGQTLTIRMQTPDWDSDELEVVVDGAGRYSADVSQSPIGLAPGVSVSANAALADGFELHADARVTGQWVSLDTGEVLGSLRPDTPLTATLRSVTGTVRAETTTQTESDGSFSLTLKDEDEEPIAMSTGEVLELATTLDDPVVLRVPQLSAWADPATDEVQGEAAAGATVRVLASGNPPEVLLGPTDPDQSDDPPPPAVRLSTADANAHFQASFAGERDLMRGMDGTVTVAGTGSTEFVRHWVVPKVAITFGVSYLEGLGRPAAQVRVDVTDPNGRQVATGETETDSWATDGRSYWYVDVVNSLGQSAGIEPGDAIHVDLDGEELRFVMPELSAVVDLDRDEILGRTAPGISVTIEADAWRPDGSSVSAFATVVSDGNGAYQHQFAPPMDLHYNDYVKVMVEPDGNEVVLDAAVPGLSVAVDAAKVNGWVEPGVPISVTLQDGGGIRAAAHVNADELAGFEAAFSDESGRPVRPNQDDLLTISAPTAKKHRELRLTLPELSMSVDRQSGEVSGRASAGGSLSLYAFNNFSFPLPWRYTSAAAPTIQPDGRFSAVLSGAPLVPGDVVALVDRLPSGHTVSTRQVLPTMAVAVDGSTVCGTTMPHTEVSALLSSADGTRLGRGDTNSRAFSTFHLQLLESGGQPAPARVGRTVRVQTGEQVLEMTVPDVKANVDWATGTVSGTGPARSRWGVRLGYMDCAFRFAGDRFEEESGDTEGDGRFQFRFGALPPATPLQVWFGTPDGYRVYRQITRMRGDVFVGTDSVAGETTPLAELTVILNSAGGTEKARATATADADGAFTATLLSPAGAPVESLPGDVVEVLTAGDTAHIDVESLSFDFSVAGGLTGQAPPDRVVRIGFELKKGGSVSFDRTADDRGRFGFQVGDVPPRVNWKLADIASIRISLAQPTGHATVSQARLGPKGQSGLRIYLPRTVNGE